MSNKWQKRQVNGTRKHNQSYVVLQECPRLFRKPNPRRIQKHKEVGMNLLMDIILKRTQWSGKIFQKNSYQLGVELRQNYATLDCERKIVFDDCQHVLIVCFACACLCKSQVVDSSIAWTLLGLGSGHDVFECH